jgi:PadR family transcriptional regulator, regulatory protein PadR
MHQDEIPPGTLCLLILKALTRGGELHGYEIANWIEQVSDEVLQVEEGSLYPALQRMLIKGWVTAKMGRNGGESTGALLPAHTIGPKTARGRSLPV